MAEKVVLHLYDLSQGMAKNMSKSFLGKQIDGIWHTGIVVYGKEFYYGGGICKDPPTKTPYGFPVQKIELGETEIPEDIFVEFLQEISGQFSADKYDLFSNNCNNFTDACSEFLVGNKIPSHITGLPKEVLATPMGQMIKPMIDNMQKQMTQNSHPMFGGQTTGSQPTNTSSFGNFNTNSFGQNAGQFGVDNSPAVLSMTAPDELQRLIMKTPAVIVDFFSYTCPPCMKIKPYFEKLALTYKARCPGLKFVSVDTQAARLIAGSYQIQSIPTFIGFWEGSQFQKFAGADIKKLESLAFTLESKIIAKNGGGLNKQESATPSFKILNPNKKDFFTFSSVNYALAIKNINGVLENHAVLNQEGVKEIFTKFSQAPEQNVKTFSKDEKFALVNWILETISFLEVSEKAIGLMDLLRMLSLNPDYLEIILKAEDKMHLFMKFWEKSDSVLKDLPKGLKLVLLRLWTNLTASEKSKGFMQNVLNSWVELFVKLGTVYREDKPSLYPIVMSLWNIVQNFSKVKELNDTYMTIGQFARVIFNDSNDKEVLLGVLLILAWLSFTNDAVKKETDSKLEKAKLALFEFSEDANVAKISRDLTTILQG